MIRNLIPGTLALGLIAIAHAQPAAAPEAPKPAIDPAKVKSDSSFFLGLRTGKQFGGFGLTEADIDTESFIKGLAASFKTGKDEVDPEKFKASMEALGEILQEREKTKAAANLEEGRKFLEGNGKREGVVTTKSGLQYEVINKGGSEKYVAPKEGEESNKQFLVNYKGSLIDGTQFDASAEGEPVPMKLTEVFDGFREALMIMPVGAKWKLFIPSNLAYGEQRGGDIAPNSTLIFEMELVKIEDAPAADGGFPIPIPKQGE